MILLVLLLLGIYGLSRTPFLSGKGSFSDAGLFQFYSFLHLRINPQPYMHTLNRTELVSLNFYLKWIIIFLICTFKLII